MTQAAVRRTNAAVNDQKVSQLCNKLDWLSEMISGHHSLSVTPTRKKVLTDMTQLPQASFTAWTEGGNIFFIFLKWSQSFPTLMNHYVLSVLLGPTTGLFTLVLFAFYCIYLNSKEASLKVSFYILFRLLLHISALTCSLKCKCAKLNQMSAVGCWSFVSITKQMWTAAGTGSEQSQVLASQGGRIYFNRYLINVNHAKEGGDFCFMNTIQHLCKL